MDIINYIKDDIIIIVPAKIKEKVIKEISLLDKMYSYKIYSDLELKKNLFFDYDINAISYIVSNYNLKFEVAKEYLNNLYYIENKKYQSSRLNELLEIKNKLMNENLLKVNNNFVDIFKNKTIYVYGFDVLSKEQLNILNKIKQPYQIIKEKAKYNGKQIVYHYQTLEEEVDNVCFQISLLLNGNKHANINKIKIANVNNDYYFTLKRYSQMYNLPIILEESNSLYNKLNVKDFLNKFEQTNSLEESLKYFETKYSNDKTTYYQLIDICNQYLSLKDNLSIDILKYLIKNTKESTKKYQNVIEVISLDDYIIDEDEYLFVLSINQGIYPKTYKNEDFLSDKEKEELNLDTSEQLNALSKEKFKILLTKSANLLLSYKESSAFNNFTKSFVLTEVEELIEEKIFDKRIEYSFSRQLDKLTLAKYYDKMDGNIQYQNHDKEILNDLIYNYRNLEYKTYDHKFKRFSDKIIQNYFTLKNKSMSYSSINNYFECSFKYYLTNILDLTGKISSQSIDIGNVFHKVLELSFKDDFDFDKVYQEQLDIIEDKVTKLYLQKLKNILKDIIKINHDNLENSSLKSVLNEKKVTVQYEKPIPVVFKGFIDKILYNKENDGSTYLAIIDYKTGKPEFKTELVQYGLSLQLPIYLYLLKHTNEFKDANVCGFYLQRLIPELFKDNTDHYLELSKNIALQGCSNSSFSVLSRFEPNYSNSTMIKSLKTNADGNFDRNSKVLSSEEMNEIAILVENKIIEAINGIFSCNFEINPKVLDGKNQSCKYCEFKDCCFQTYEDLKYLDGKKNDYDNGGEK